MTEFLAIFQVTYPALSAVTGQFPVILRAENWFDTG